MSKKLVIIGALITIILTWVIGINGGAYSIDGITIIKTYFINISLIFSLDATAILIETLALIFAISPIIILIGSKTRVIPIIFGILVLLPAVGYSLLLLGDSIGNTTLYEIGFYLCGGIFDLNDAPLVAGIFPLSQLIDASYFDVVSLIFLYGGGLVGGLLALIGGIKNKK